MGDGESDPVAKPGGEAFPTRRQFLKKAVTSTVSVGGVTLIGSTIVSSVLPGCTCKDKVCPECMQCTGTNTCGPPPGGANQCTDNNYCKTINTCSGGVAEGANSCANSNECKQDNTCDGTGAQGDNTCQNNSCDNKNKCVSDNGCSGINQCGTGDFWDDNNCQDQNSCWSQNLCIVPPGGEGSNSCGNNHCWALNSCQNDNKCFTTNTCAGTIRCTPYTANQCHGENTA